MQPHVWAGIIQANIPDKANVICKLHAFCGWWRFIYSIQTTQKWESFCLATLPEQVQKIPLTGKVIWISQKQNGIKPAIWYSTFWRKGFITNQTENACRS